MENIINALNILQAEIRNGEITNSEAADRLYMITTILENSIE